MKNERRLLRIGAYIGVLATVLVGVLVIVVLHNQIRRGLNERQVESARKQVGSSLEEFRQILEQESRRPFTEYSHSNFRGVSAQSFVQFSNISSLQPSVRIPGLVGFFQIAEKQKLELPFFPEGLPTGRQDRERRRDLARKVLSTIFKTQPLSASEDLRTRFSQLFRGVWLPNINTSEIVPLKAIPTKVVSPKVLSKSAPPIETLEALRSQSLNLASTSQAFPIQAFLLENGYLVFYRSVLHNGRTLTQGFVVDQKSFFGSLFGELTKDASKQLTLVVENQDLGIFPTTLQSSYPLFQVDELLPIQGLSLLVSGKDAKLDATQITILALVALVVLVIIGAVILMYKTAIRQLELSERQAAFVSSVSHELRTPITAIRMHGEILKAGWSKDEAAKESSYDYILKESERLSRLIENVLRYARIGRDSDPLNIERVSLPELRTLITEKVAPLVTQNQFLFELIDNLGSRQHGQTDSSAIDIDRDALTQILINLVDNGVKFSRTSVEKKITLTLENSDQSLKIGVRDFGPGISPGITQTNPHKVFELFFRAEDEMTRTTPGTGLGLALVKSLSDRMGLKVWFENRSPGCEFLLQIPVSKSVESS